MQDVVIVGGSVAGASLGTKLAKDYDVTILEEHPHFKKTCSGIVTKVFHDLIKVKKDVIVNKVDTFRIYAPNKNYIEIKIDQPDTIMHRESFNKFLAEKAMDEGCKLINSCKFMGLNNGKILIQENNQNKKIKSNVLIGADGALSQVAKSTNLYGNRNFFIGVKAHAKLNHDNVIDVFPYIGKGGFAWIVPLQDNICEVGTMDYMKAGTSFNEFTKNFKIFDKEASIIPVYNPNLNLHKKINDTRIYLIGDAATTAKATTGGSIIQSLKSSEILASSIKKNDNYTKKVRKEIGKDLWLHLQMRKSFDKMSLNDWNKLVNAFNDKKVKSLLENYSRDTPSSFLFKIFLRKPSLVSFVSKLF